LRISELTADSRFETSRRCSVVESLILRNRLRKSLTFREYRSAPVGPIADTDLTSFSNADNSASIDRADAAVATPELSTAIATAKQVTATNRVRNFISIIQCIDRFGEGDGV
jgi:hypothetical protein